MFIAGAIKNTILWIDIFGTHPLLILLYSTHFVVCIQINMLIQLRIFQVFFHVFTGVYSNRKIIDVPYGK